MRKNNLLLLPVLAAFSLMVACSQDAELEATDPANCERIKEDFPEQYEQCLEELN